MITETELVQSTENGSPRQTALEDFKPGKFLSQDRRWLDDSVQESTVGFFGLGYLMEACIILNTKPPVSIKKKAALESERTEPDFLVYPVDHLERLVFHHSIQNPYLGLKYQVQFFLLYFSAFIFFSYVPSEY